MAGLVVAMVGELEILVKTLPNNGAAVVADSSEVRVAAWVETELDRARA